MNAFWTALFFVFIAEMGDKTQLVSLAFGSKYKLWTVMSAISVAVFCMLLFWVALGEFASHLIPLFWLNMLSGVLFIGFGLWTLKPPGEEEEAAEITSGKLSPWLTVATAFFLAELGDKTLLAAATIASQQHSFVQVWIGGSLGMIAADALAVALGRLVGKQLPEKAVRYVTAVIFILSGIWTLVEAFKTT